MIQSSPTARTYDAVIIGGGPAGTCAAITLADAGKSTLILERESFPRFRIGESLLPKTVELLKELDLEERMRQQPHWIKKGIAIGFGDGRRELTPIAFQDMMHATEYEAFNMRRSLFDEVLMHAAQERGAEVLHKNGVQSIESIEAGNVRLRTDDGTDIRAHAVIDASGQASVVGRKLKTRQIMSAFRNVAYFEHFENVERPSGKHANYAGVIMCREGWFWMIPLDEKTTSIGAVLDEQIARQINVPANQRLRWCIENCPVVAQAMEHARGPETNQVTSDFSYTCSPYAGSGYFLAGDAAAFVDPVWSTGATFGMLGGQHAAQLLCNVLDGKLSDQAAAKRHHAWVSRHRKTLLRLIGSFYDHAFRELMIEGQGPMGVHRALITLLGGEIFPSVPTSVRWRWELLDALTGFHRRIPIVGKRRPHSLFAMAGLPMNDPEQGIVAGPANAMRTAWRTA